MHWLFYKEKKLLEDNILMRLMKEKVQFDLVAVLRVLVMENLRV